MSPVVSFSNRDLLRNTVVEPAWYRCLIVSVGEMPAKDQSKGASTNYPVEATIIKNADTGDDKFKDVPLEYMFNSKAIGFAVGFLEALGVKIGAGERYDLAAAAGKEIEIFVENDTYQNRLVNRVNHKYRAPQ